MNIRGWNLLPVRGSLEYIGRNVPHDKWIKNPGKIGKQGIEGNISTYPRRVNIITECLNSLENPTYCIEIGFNAGHSACVILDTIPINCKFRSFTLLNHGYTMDCSEIIKKEFKEYDFDVVFGDSTVTLPKFFKTIKEIDFSYIDGAHHGDWPYLDGKMCMEHTRKGGIIVFDDPKIKIVRKAIDKLKIEFPEFKHLKQHFGKTGHGIEVYQRIEN